MSAESALGLWRTSFGPVKIERDTSASDDSVMGIWVYQRAGREIVGYFTGELDGNVLEFTWHEPAEPAPLTGRGWLAFDPSGERFSGKWWTEANDRSGDWSGWRPEGVAYAPASASEAPTEAPPPPPANGGSWDDTAPPAPR